MNRPQFHEPEGPYFLSHSVGLLPAATADWVADGLVTAWRDRPAEAWPAWLEEVSAFRQTLARLFNQEARWFCPQANVSSGLTKLLHALPFREDRPVILISGEAFPSIGFVARAAEPLGYRVRLIDRSEDCLDPTVWQRQLGDDVGVVIITHVHSNTGRLLPAAEIADLARARGVWSMLDVAQSAGVIPIDLGALNVDAVAGSCVKWLCGGPGAGYLFVRPELVDRCQPLDVGWFSHADPFEFDIERFRYAPDALRFWGGTPNVASLSMARRSVDVMLEVGVGEIRAHNLRLTDRLLDGLDRGLVQGLVVSPTPATDRSGTVVINAGARTDALETRLIEAGVFVDRREPGIRISPHIYNSPAEIDTLVEVIGRSLR